MSRWYLPRWAVWLAVLIGIGLALACGATRPSPVRYDARLLTHEELVSRSFGSLDEAIRQLRPTFFNAQGGRLQVWVEGSPYGVYVLSTITAGVVERVEWLTETEAFARFGSRAYGGPSLVVTFRRGP